MNIHSIDHIVLVVADPLKTCAFYQKVLGLLPVERPHGNWALRFGHNKINLQILGNVPKIASQTTRGSANFCLITDTPIEKVFKHLVACDVEIIDGPVQKEGAIGPLMSLYFYDIDGNLVEVSNQLKGQSQDT
jgi:catechol 2,3-dioxygenase-like lactoylglutathione lyase family enzyme